MASLEGVLELKLNPVKSSYTVWCELRGSEFKWNSSTDESVEGDQLSPITAIKQLHDLPVLSKERQEILTFERHDLLVS